MVNITELKTAAKNALITVFAKNDAQIAKIDVEENGGLVFDDELDGVSVECSVGFPALSWFDGNLLLNIGYCDVLREAHIHLFIGDECIDVDKAMDAADSFTYDDAWRIEQIDDFLMLVSEFVPGPCITLEEQLIRRLRLLEDEMLVDTIAPVVDCFR